MKTETVDVAIVGSGPAGVSTALNLIKRNVAWASRMLVLDKAVHPREKLCGGGVTPAADEQLSRLGLTPGIPQIPIREIELRCPGRIYRIRGDLVFRVYRRSEFDHWFVGRARERGVVVHEGTEVSDVRRGTDYLELQTDRSLIRARVVVAADGSLSLVRRKMGRGDRSRISRLLEILTPEPADIPAFEQGIAVFDFTRLTSGVQGYYWDFPSLVEGETFMNRGIFDSRVRTERPKAPLKATLRDSLGARERRLEDYRVRGFPIFRYRSRERFSMPRILYVGDAAGADPLLGEGISFALAYGEVAAAEIDDAFARMDFGFEGYRRRVLRNSLLRTLPARAVLARLFYRLSKNWQRAAIWRMTPAVVGVYNWYHPDFPRLRLAVEKT